MDATTKSNANWLCFRVERRWLGIPTSTVKKLIGVEEAVILPGCPQYVEGVFGFNGKAVPLINVNTFLELDGSKKDLETPDTCRVLIVGVDDMTVGIKATEVTGIISSDDRTQQVARFSNEGQLGRYVKNELNEGKRIVSLIDISDLLRDARI